MTCLHACCCVRASLEYRNISRPLQSSYWNCSGIGDPNPLLPKRIASESPTDRNRFLSRPNRGRGEEESWRRSLRHFDVCVFVMRCVIMMLRRKWDGGRPSQCLLLLLLLGHDQGSIAQCL